MYGGQVMSTKTKKQIAPPQGIDFVKNGLKNFFKSNAFILMAFIIPFLVMLTNFAIKQFAPFGDQQILVVDLWHQYYPFLVDFQDKLISGQSMLYSWSNGMGGNYLALLSYYVASPINFLTVFIPESFLREFLMLSVCVDIGCASGFMAIFLKKTFHKDGLPLVFFSAGYGCCAFFMGYYWNVIWLNTVALLPLVALGMVLLWREGKFCLYTITLALSVIANYYVGLFACIFVLLSFIGYSIIYWNGIKDFFARLLRTGIFSGIALMITAFISLPAFNALQLTYSTNNSWPEYWRLYYSWSEIMSQTLDFIAPSTKENLPNIACGVAAIFFGLIFLTARKVNLRAKIFSVALLAFLVVSFNSNVFDYVWHGMHFTNMIPHRFAYLFSFVLLVIAYRAYTLIDKAKIWDIIIGFAGSMLLIVISTIVQSGTPLWGSALLIAIMAVVTALYIFRIYPKIVLDLLIFTLVCGEIFIASYNGIKAVGSTGTSNYPEGEDVTADVISAMNTLEANTTDMWRAEMTQTQTLNDSSLNDYNGVSQFSSMSNVSVTKFLEEFGCQGWQSGNRYTYRESTPITNLFLNIKYLISRNGTYATSDYMSPCYQNSSEVLLKNNYYLPMGFVTDKALLDYTLEDRDPDDFSTLNAIEKQNELFTLATGVDKDVMSIIEPAGINTSDSNDGSVFINKQLPDSIHGYDFGIALNNAQQPTNVNIVYNITDPGDYCVYSLYYGTSLESKNVSIKKDGNSLQSGLDISRPYIINAGSFEAGQQLSVSLESLPVGTNANFVCFVAKVNDDVFKEGYNKLAENTLTATKVTDTQIKGEIDSNRDGLFYTSVVYEEGWTVKVDGEKVDTKKVGGAMLAFDITKGKHTIEMSYTPSGYLVGSFASILGILLLIFAALIYRRYLSKTFLFKYKTHPDANPDRFEKEEDETTDISRFAHKSSEENYVKGETPIVARVVFSIIFSFIYFPIWFAGIIKKIKILCEEDPTYTFDIILSIIVPFYFVYAAYKYSHKTESLAAVSKLRTTTTFSHTTLELGASCGIFVSIITFVSNFAANFTTYVQENQVSQSVDGTTATTVEHTVSLIPTGTSLFICIFCLLAGIAMRILNLYCFDLDIKKLANKKFN
jgi:uncharacterized membrane protein YfhO